MTARALVEVMLNAVEPINVAKLPLAAAGVWIEYHQVRREK